MTDREGRIDDEGKLKLGHKNKTTRPMKHDTVGLWVLWDVMGNERLTYIDVSDRRMDKGCAGLWESPTTINNLILSNIRMTGTVMMMIKWSSVLSTTRRRLMTVQWIRFIGPLDGTWPQCVKGSRYNYQENQFSQSHVNLFWMEVSCGVMRRKGLW